MEHDLLVELFTICNRAGFWALQNAFPLAVGAVLGSGLVGATFGLTSDVLKRGTEAIRSLAGRLTRDPRE